MATDLGYHSGTERYASPGKPYKTDTHYHPVDANTPGRHNTSFSSVNKQDYHAASNYSNIPLVHTTGDCNLLDCHDDMVQQNRAFDGDIDRTSPEESSSRALDLTVNFNSSLADDDALVDKVISKGYATLDDCSNMISPQTWKQESTRLPVTSSPLPHSPTQLLDDRTRFQFLPVIQHGYSPSGVPEVNYPRITPMYGTQPRTTVRDYMSSPYSSAIYNNPGNSSNPSPNPDYAKQVPTSFTKRYSSYSNQAYTAVKDNVSGSPSPSCEPSSELLRNRYLTSDSPSQSYRDSSYPFTHISGSLQMTPMNPRKKWLMEEEIRLGLLQSTSSRLQST